ncbi:hypothetical protein [Malikia spinosa]|uniref:hypothetical protein n=1 Tax=Malikia spinosa TaxID=86180 RepID=UPI003FA337C0
MTPRHWPLAALFALIPPLCPARADSGGHRHERAKLQRAEVAQAASRSQVTPSQPGVSW